MEFAHRRLFYRSDDLRLAWEGATPRQKLRGMFRDSSNKPREALNEAGHFLGGALLDDGFKVFKNGGLPLLERRPGKLIEEIVLRSSPHIRGESFVPVRVYLHLSHTGLQDVRMRYWRPPSRAPSGLAFLDLGQLEFPPCWVIWNVGMNYDCLVEMVEWVRRLALPWFDLFENSGELRSRLFQGMVTGLDVDRSLELILAQFGPFEAIRFMEECVLPDDHLGPLVRNAMKQIRNANASGAFGIDKAWNIATIATACSLV